MTFDNYSDIYPGMTAAKIRELADKPQRESAMLRNIANEMASDHAKIGRDTDGDITAPTQVNVAEAKKLTQRLGDNGEFGSATIKLFANKVEVFDDKVDDLNRRYFEMIRAKRGMNDPDVKSGVAKPRSHAEAASAAKAALSGEYARALDRLDNDADHIAGMLRGEPKPGEVRELIRAGVMSLTSAASFGVTLSMKDKTSYYEAVMAGMSPAERTKYLIDQKVDPDVVAAVLKNDPETARYAVNEAKTKIDGINKGDFDKDDLKSLVPLLTTFGKSGAFAAPLLNKVGPRGLLRVSQIVAQMESDYKPDSYRDKDGGAVDPKLGKLIGDFQKSMSVTLGTATGGPDGYAPGTPDSQRLDSGFAERLNELGREKTTINFGGDRDYGVELYGYQALAPLLTTGKFEPEFLTDIANGMYHFDRTEGEHGSSPWADTTSTLGANHGVRLDWTEGEGSTHAAGFDPLRGLMKGLGNNPEAAHDFFTSSREYSDNNDHDSDTGYNEKLRYLMNERTWGLPGDQPWRGLGVDDGGYYNEDIYKRENDTNAMDPLGKALAAATSRDDQASATLFGDVVYETAHKSEGADFGDIRDDFARMANNHMGAINSAFTSNVATPDGDIDPFTKGVQHDPGFAANDDIDLQKFLAEVGRDEGAKKDVVAGQAVYMQSGYQHIMHDPNDTLADRIGAISTRVNTPMGAVLGALDYGTSDQTFSDQQESDQTHNDKVDDKYAVIGFFTDQLPFNKIPVGGDLVSTGVSSYLDALKSSEQIDTTAVANALVGDLHGGSENHVKSTAETTLIATMSPEDRKELGITWPEGDNGKPKPISEWDAGDRSIFQQQLNSNQKLQNVLGNFGDDARSDYQQGFDSSKTNIKQKG